MPSIALPVSLRGQLLSGTRTFSPSSLFAAGEPGVWYDPSDLTTLFQDPAGTTAVTAPGQTVALMLDKSRGLVLGTELVTNGDFSAGATGWQVGGGWTVSGGAASTAAGFTDVLYQNMTLVAGRTYQVSFDLSNASGGTYPSFGGGSTVFGPLLTATQRHTVYLVAVTGNTDFRFYKSAASATFTVDNISVRELPGNHATQGTIASRPIYGVVPQGGRRNLLLQTEAFSNAVWDKTLCSVTDQGSGVWRLQAAAGAWVLSQSIPGNSVPHTLAIDVKSNGTALNNARLSFSGIRVVSFTATSEWQRISVTGFHNNSTIVGVLNDGSAAVDILIRFPQFELGSTATPYQRVTTQYDVTEAGVQSCSYLFFNGTNNSMATSTITPGTDKAQVFAGVRKLNLGQVGIIFETSAAAESNAGAFRFGRDSSGYEYFIGSGGTTYQQVLTDNSAFDAPVTNTLTGLFDISAPFVTVKANGAQIGQNTASQGTGNFLAYPLYLGMRQGATPPSSNSLFFNGFIFGLITRFGPNLDTTTINATEYWVGDKTGINIANNTSATIFARDDTAVLDRFNQIIERRA